MQKSYSDRSAQNKAAHDAYWRGCDDGYVDASPREARVAEREFKRIWRRFWPYDTTTDVHKDDRDIPCHG